MQSTWILAFFAAIASATQINYYDGDDCSSYLGTVYSSNWSCEDIPTSHAVDLVGSNANCNIYGLSGCQSWLGGETDIANSCWRDVAFRNINSVACSE
jgi:hypothetical protein